MKTIVIVIQIDEEHYPTLCKMHNERIEYWVREGYAQLGNVYDALPPGEDMLPNPLSVVVAGD